MKIKVDKGTRKQLLDIYKSKRIYLEGNILKLIDCDGDEEFQLYVEAAINKDKEVRRKRLDITKRVQSQNTELVNGQNENDRVNKQLIKALDEAEKSKSRAVSAKDEAEKSKDEANELRLEAEEARVESEKARMESDNAKNSAENDLELIQKKSQFELIGTIVKVSLWVILGVGVSTTLIYTTALFLGVDTTGLFTTWSNIIGILLTNSFSIIGTIMGVKYALGNKE
jgi:hypothetical protein